MVVGDRQPYIAALITLDPEELPKWAAQQGLAGDIATLAGNEQVRELIQGIVDDVNADGRATSRSSASSSSPGTSRWTTAS